MSPPWPLNYSFFVNNVEIIMLTALHSSVFLSEVLRSLKSLAEDNLSLVLRAPTFLFSPPSPLCSSMVTLSPLHSWGL